MNPLYLVACASKKLDHPARACGLYCSAWFNKARRYVENKSGPWRILSAKHGLVDPDQTLAPYDLSLNDLTREERAAWALRVLDQLDGVLHKNQRIVMLAGVAYRDHLEGELVARGHHVGVPMRGLMIGQQMRWLTQSLMVDAWNRDHPAGASVRYSPQYGGSMHMHTRSEAWMLETEAMVLLDGRVGGYPLDCIAALDVAKEAA